MASRLLALLVVAGCTGQVDWPRGQDAALPAADAALPGTPDAAPSPPDAPPAPPPPDAAPTGSCKTECLGVECGPIPDGCGGVIECGDCMGPPGQYCVKLDPPAFRNDVHAASEQVKVEHPEYFDFTDSPGGDSVRVLDTPAFRAAVVAIMDTAEHQTIPDPNDGREIRVKDPADWAENYLLVTSAGYSAYKYTSTCFPAGF